jgi:hypothetical protein
MKWRCVEVGGPEIRGVTEISEFGGANPGLVHFRVDYVSYFNWVGGNCTPNVALAMQPGSLVQA